MRLSCGVGGLNKAVLTSLFESQSLQQAQGASHDGISERRELPVLNRKELEEKLRQAGLSEAQIERLAHVNLPLLDLYSDLLNDLVNRESMHLSSKCMPEASWESMPEDLSSRILDRESRSYSVSSSPVSAGPYSSGGGGGACFIATAAYGTPLSEELAISCRFRDMVLAKRRWGRIATWIYYRLSPPIAERIGKHAFLRAVTRLWLGPAVRLAKWVESRSHDIG